MGIGELLVILVVALIVLGPQQLPGIAYKLGRCIHAFKRFTESTKRELQEQLQFEQLIENERKAQQVDAHYQKQSPSEKAAVTDSDKR